jgi:hypothetical protein
MLKGGHDIFALVINFSKVDWSPKHITFSLLKQQILVDKLWLEI